MPFGSHSVLCEIIDDIVNDNLPLNDDSQKTVLDLGIGNGVNACLIKNYKRKWIIDGVEIFEDYRNPMWNVYRKVYINDIRKIKEVNKEVYDYVIMTDVIEHFELDEALKLLNDLKKLLKPGGSLYISTPSIFIEQGPFEGNDAETHLCLITIDHLKDQDYKILKDGSLDNFKHMMLLGKYTNDS